MADVDAVALESAGFSGELIGPDNASYDDLRRAFNAMVDRRPALIARCRGARDASIAVGFARQHRLEISVFGGGHSVAGHSMCDDGVVIDLRPMKAIAIDPQSRTCRAEAGLTWGELDAATQAHGLAVTGGRMSTTGIGGLSLGGGSGWLERRFGYTADNLLSAEIVTADGEILTISDDEHPHLFWGIRGGGGNFGVVTSFEFRLHPVGPTVLGGALMYPAQMAEGVLRNFRDVMTCAADEVGAGVALVTAPSEAFIPEPLRGEPVVLACVCYAGPVGNAAEEAVRPLREFGPAAMDMVEPMPYVALQQLNDSGSPAGLRNYMTADFLAALSDEAIEVIARHHLSKPSLLSDIVVFPGGGAVARVPERTIAAGQRRAPFNYLIHSKWADADDDAENVTWTKDLQAAMKPHAAGGAYLNYIGEEGQDRILAAVGSSAHTRLQALKDRYDPANVFNRNQNIRPTGAVPAEAPPAVHA